MTEDTLLNKTLGDYQLLELLGRGGMARVYYGVDTNKIKQPAAIKVIDTPYRTDEEYSRRFEREAQAIDKLQHPNIVNLYQYGESDGILYMAMQYIQGSDLEAVLENFQQDGAYIEPEDTARIIREICQALDYAHQQGIIHRDIKPSNIMLTEDKGQAILTDFGLVLLTEVGTKGEIFGSPHYISPEQAISSAGAVPQSDLYAIGVILYEMFTGVVPFDADDPMDVAMMHMSETPRSPREIRPEISAEVEKVVLKAMAREVSDRYPTGKALADALEHAVKGQKNQPTSPTPAEAPRKTVLERIHLEMIEHPLPAMPAAVATKPASSPERAATVPQPAPAPSINQAAAPPAYRNRTIPAVKNQRSPLFFMGLGALAMLAVLAIIGVILLTSESNDDDGSSNQSASGAEQATDPVTEESFVPVPTFTETVLDVTSTAFILEVTTISPSATAEQSAATVTPLPSITPSPSLAPTLTPLSTPMESAPVVDTGESSYKLALLSQPNHLLIINNGDIPIPLDTLLISHDEIQLAGNIWGIPSLNSEECLAVLLSGSSEGNTQENINLECTRTGIQHTVESAFWRQDFQITLNNQTITCSQDRAICTHAFSSGRQTTTSVPAQTQQPAAGPIYYEITLHTIEGEKGLFLINTGKTPVPLNSLSFEADEREPGTANGSVWGIPYLQPGECVMAAEDNKVEEFQSDNPFNCLQAGTPYAVKGKDRFWKKDFFISFNNAQTKTCIKDQGKSEDGCQFIFSG